MESAEELAKKLVPGEKLGSLTITTERTARKRERVAKLIEADRAATEAKVREEYAGLVEKAKTLAMGLQNDIWGDINDYNCAVSDVLVALAALEGKVSQ
jgi:hypothetical protein